MLEVPKTKLKIIAYRLRDAEKILNAYKSYWKVAPEAKLLLSDWKLKELELCIRQASQDLLHLVEGTDLKDVEKEIERLQRSLIPSG